MKNNALQVFIRKSRVFSLAMTALMLLLYFGFIMIIAFNKSLFAYKVTSSLTLGIVCGLGLIILAWLFTGVYTWWANNFYDKEVEKLKNEYSLE